MKKIKIFIILLLLNLIVNVNASSGAIKQDSVIECNNTYYGNHGNPTHWHVVEKKNEKWTIASGVVEIPSCYIKKVNVMEKVTFSKCSDGDTARFIINGEEKKVRFLAIDTPEVDSDDFKMQKYGKEASDYTCNALKNAKEIYLEYDGNSDKEDKYGRILAFVHIDGILLEKKLIEQGLAKVYYIYGDYAHVDELRKIEDETRNKKVGMWSENIPEIKEESESKEDNEILDIINTIMNIIKKIFAILLK